VLVDPAPPQGSAGGLPAPNQTHDRDASLIFLPPLQGPIAVQACSNVQGSFESLADNAVLFTMQSYPAH
jgi:hypothetical protein